MIELRCPGRSHAPAGEEVGRFLGRHQGLREDKPAAEVRRSPPHSKP
jgi:hypothetical protein